MNVGSNITLHNQKVGRKTFLNGAEFILFTEHFRTVIGRGGDGIQDGNANFIDKVIHLVDGDIAIRRHKAEGIGADGDGNTQLIGFAKVLVCARKALLDNRLAGKCVKFGSPVRRIGGIPRGKKADGRRKKCPLFRHELHRTLIKLKTVDKLRTTKTHAIVCGIKVVV